MRFFARDGDFARVWIRVRTIAHVFGHGLLEIWFCRKSHPGADSFLKTNGIKIYSQRAHHDEKTAPGTFFGLLVRANIPL